VKKHFLTSGYASALAVYALTAIVLLIVLS
jgi:hypothetical protein